MTEHRMAFSRHPNVSAWLLSAALSLFAHHTLAGDKSQAAALAQEATALGEAGKLDQACAKFAESLKLDRSAKVAYNLAHCSELAGKLATAWEQYLEAQKIAKLERDDQVASLAEQAAAKLKPRLPRVVLHVPAPELGLSVHLDEQAISEAAWGVELPVDPGPHVLVAEAPGREKLVRRLTPIAEAETRELTLPSLTVVTPSGARDVPTAPVAPPKTVIKSDVSSPRHVRSSPPAAPVLPWVIAGASAAVAIGGLGAGWVAKTKYQDAKSQCLGGVRKCPPTAVEDGASALGWANASNVLVGVGAAGIVTGIVLLLTSRAPATPSAVGLTRVLPVVGSGQLGVVCSEAF